MESAATIAIVMEASMLPIDDTAKFTVVSAEGH
jgi:hypothetical protein